jgi:hypothetical protein
VTVPAIAAGLPPGSVTASALLLCVAASDVWVYRDAVRHRDAGAPVVLLAGGLRIETPERWFLACLVAWVLALPAYLTCRRS